MCIYLIIILVDRLKIEKANFLLSYLRPPNVTTRAKYAAPDFIIYLIGGNDCS